MNNTKNNEEKKWSNERIKKAVKLTSFAVAYTALGYLCAVTDINRVAKKL